MPKYSTSIFILLVALASCKKPESTSQAAALSVATNSDSTINPNVSWCKKGETLPLSRWQQGNSDMFVSYCIDDSLDEQKITQHSRLDVRQEDLKNNNSVIWKIHDEVGQGLSTLKLYRPSFSMIDLDGDGDMKTFFGYYVASQGMDPVSVKFIVHAKGTKFAVRGQIPRTEDDSALYKMEYDQAFSKASPRLKSVTDSLLKDFVIKICQDSEFGIWAPVPPQVSRHD